MSPFFSICIPATGRSSTIERALKSIFNQDFKDFEVIVTTRNDKLTYNIVERFDASNRITNISINEERKYCNDWNDSILLANGKFIVVLEGDDYFYDNYLTKSFEIINKFNFDICLFATTNRDVIPNPFSYDSKDFFNFIYSFKAIPAPSESIFPRVSNDKINTYNVKDFKYAPEIDLYLRLSTKINNFERISKTGIHREASSDPYNRISFLYYRDQLIIIIKYFQVLNIFKALLSFKNLIILYAKSIIKYSIWKVKK